MYSKTEALCVCCGVFFFKQKTAYEMRISDWSSDVCSSDLPTAIRPLIESSVLRCSSARSSTTVDATDRARQKTSPAPAVQPPRCTRPAPTRAATTIWTPAPGTAHLRPPPTYFTEHSSPTPTITRITPTSRSEERRVTQVRVT